jgi:hypothetical protein
MKTNRPVIGFRLDIVVEPVDVGYRAYCPAFEELCWFADTELEARRVAKRSLVTFLRFLVTNHYGIPQEVIVTETLRKYNVPIRQMATKEV